MNDADPRLPDPRMIPDWRRPPEPVTRAEPAGAARIEAGTDDFVRPFIITGGRTRPLREGLRVETLVRATPAALSAPLEFERRAIVELCQEPLSVAEVAATLSLPLGIARVLIADLVAERFASVNESNDELPLHVIERIRDGVRAL